MNISYILLILLFLLIISYIYIELRNRTKLVNDKEIKSILNRKQSLIFEISEIIILTIVILVLYEEKNYIISAVFLVALIEHIFQIFFCYRQTIDSLQFITIFIFIIIGCYAFYIKNYWIIPLFIIGILIHICSLLYNKSFSDKICLTSSFSV